MAITAAQLNVAINVEGAQKAKGEIAGVGDAVDNADAKRKMLGSGLLGMGGAITGLFAASSVAAIGFGEQMSNVNSIAQLTTQELSAVSDEVLKIATNTGQGPEVLAAGLYDIYSSGFAGAEGLQVLEVSANGANAGLTTTAVAAKGLTAVLNAYNLTADDSGHIMDVMFQTVNEGVITFEELSSNMANTVPLASALGVSFEELAAGYARMTLSGVPAAQAETQLSALMRAAINPTTALTEAVQAHGYASVESLIATEGLTGYLNLLTEASGGTSEGLFELLGTAEATNAALLLGGENADEYTASVERMEKSSEGLGATQTALNKQMESTSFSLRLLKTNLQAAAIAIGVQLEPGIKAVAKAMTAGIKAFLNFSKPVQQVIGIVTALAGALALVAGGIILFGSQIAAAAGLFLSLLGPIALVVAAVAGLYLAWQSNFLGIRDITSGAVGAITGFLEPVTDFFGRFKDAWDATAPPSDVMSQINAWGGIVTEEMTLAERAINALDVATGGLVTRLREMTAVDVAVAIGSWAFDTAVTLASALGTWLLTQAVNLAYEIPGVTVNIAKWIKGTWDDLWTTVKGWLSGADNGMSGDGTGGAMPGDEITLGSIAVNIAGWIKGTVPDIWAAVMSWGIGGGGGSGGDPTGMTGGGAAAANSITIGSILVNISEWVQGDLPNIAMSLIEWINTQLEDFNASGIAQQVGAGIARAFAAGVGFDVVGASFKAGLLTSVNEEMGDSSFSDQVWAMVGNLGQIPADIFAGAAEEIVNGLITAIAPDGSVNLGPISFDLGEVSFADGLGESIKNSILEAIIPTSTLDLGDVKMELGEIDFVGITESSFLTAFINSVVPGGTLIMKGIDFDFSQIDWPNKDDLIGMIPEGVRSFFSDPVGWIRRNIGFGAGSASPEQGYVEGVYGNLPGSSKDVGSGQIAVPSVAPFQDFIDAANNAGNAASTNGPLIQTFASNISGLNAPISELGATAGPAGENFAKLGTDISTAGTQIGTAATAMTTAMVSGMQRIAQAAQQGMQVVTQAIVQGMTQARTVTVAGVAAMAASMVAGMATFRAAVTSGMASAVAAVRSGIAQMVAAASAGRGQMMSAGLGIGAALGQGIAAGIRGQIGAVAAAAAALVTTAVAAARNAGAINSPSRIMDQQVGQMLGLGAVVGVEKMYPRMNQAMAGLISVPTVPLQAGGGLNSGYGNGGSGQTITIDARFINNAPIYGVEDLDERLAQHTNQLADALDRNRLAMGVQ